MNLYPESIKNSLNSKVSGGVGVGMQLENERGSP